MQETYAETTEKKVRKAGQRNAGRTHGRKMKETHKERDESWGNVQETHAGEKQKERKKGRTEKGRQRNRERRGGKNSINVTSQTRITKIAKTQAR